MKNAVAALLVCILAGCSSHAVQKPVAPVPAPEVIAPAAPETFDVSKGVELHWLDGTPPPVARGVSWGVPWPEGAVHKDTMYELTGADGKDVVIQTWPLAYWPDNSLKWTGVSAVVGPESGKTLKLIPGGRSSVSGSPRDFYVQETGDAIEIDNGQSVWMIGKSGTDLVRSISFGGTCVARAGRLVGEVEDRSDWDADHVLRVESFVSEITSAEVEQEGTDRIVVKVEGKHKFQKSDRTWLPFVVRFYFYVYQGSVRMVHTFIFDGDQEKDFIRGIGVRFDVPMHEEFQNRHVRLAGDQGFLAEPVQLIAGAETRSRICMTGKSRA